MDLNLLIRRTRPPGGAYGRECWLHGFYPPGESVPIVKITDHPGDIVYAGDGLTYTAYRCSYQPPATQSDAALPEARMTVSNALRSLRPSLEAYDLFRGFTLKSIQYNDLEPAANYTDQVKNMVVIAPEISQLSVTFRLGVPGALLDRYPAGAEMYNGGTCRHRFRLSAGVYGARCGYTAPAIEDIQTPGVAGRLAIKVTGHGWSTEDTIEISGVTGLTPALDGVYAVEYFNADWVKLDDTEGATTTGTWDSNGLAGYYYCPQHRLACLARNQLAAIGLQAGLRSDALRVGV